MISVIASVGGEPIFTCQFHQVGAYKVPNVATALAMAESFVRSVRMNTLGEVRMRAEETVLVTISEETISKTNIQIDRRPTAAGDTAIISDEEKGKNVDVSV